MRFKVIAALVMVTALTGASAGVALATSRSSHATTGVEDYWISGFNRVTPGPTVFIGTGLFTDAGSLNFITNKTVLSKGSFFLDNSKITTKVTSRREHLFHH